MCQWFKPIIKGYNYKFIPQFGKHKWNGNIPRKIRLSQNSLKKKQKAWKVSLRLVLKVSFGNYLKSSALPAELLNGAANH